MTTINSFRDLTVWFHAELETLFAVIQRRKLIRQPTAADKRFALLDPVGKMLHGLVESLERRDQA